MGKRIGARLGMATTGELLEEVEARLRGDAMSGHVESVRALDALLLIARIQERLDGPQLAYKTSDAS